MRTHDCFLNKKDPKSYFKKYNSNKFNTVNASGGIINSSFNSSHAHSNSITHKNYTRHSIDLEKQYVLQKKYHDSLNNYPNSRYTPTGYESSDRPNSVIDSINQKSSQDSSTLVPSSNKLEMYKIKNHGKVNNTRYSHHNSVQ